MAHALLEGSCNDYTPMITSSIVVLYRQVWMLFGYCGYERWFKTELADNLRAPLSGEMAFLKFANGGGPNLNDLMKVVLGKMPEAAIAQPDIVVGDASSENIKPNIVVDVYFCESCWIVHGGLFCPVRGPLSLEGLSGVSVHHNLPVAALCVHNHFPVAPTVKQGLLLGDVPPASDLVVHARASSLSPSIHNLQINMDTLKVPAGKLANSVKQDVNDCCSLCVKDRYECWMPDGSDKKGVWCRHCIDNPGNGTCSKSEAYRAKHGITSRRSPRKRGADNNDDHIVKSKKMACKSESKIDIVPVVDHTEDNKMENWFLANFIQELNSKLYNGLVDLSADCELSSEQCKSIRAIANNVVGPFKRFNIKYRKDFRVAERNFWCKQLNYKDFGSTLKNVILGKVKYSISIDPCVVMVIKSSNKDGVPPKGGPSGSKAGGAKVKEAKGEVVGKGKAKVVDEEEDLESKDNVIIGKTSKDKVAEGEGEKDKGKKKEEEQVEKANEDFASRAHSLPALTQ
ncbi:hypothetical protein T439DRAFT_335446 [Meredithblackwellia eburnea MCA 4105]